MSKQQFELSRRKALAGIGGIGVASAGAGLGTSAYFTDTESFDNNTITAGELDLRIDWQQLYYGPEKNTDNYAPYGAAGRPFVNAHPDAGGDSPDGEQSLDTGELKDFDDVGVVSYSDNDANIQEYLTCDTLENFSVPEDFDNGVGEPQSSLIELDDVKPGDSGEITFSLHLCDNPGYMWWMGQTGTFDEDLAKAISVRAWYDIECTNEFDEEDGDRVLVETTDLHTFLQDRLSPNGRMLNPNVYNGAGVGGDSTAGASEGACNDLDKIEFDPKDSTGPVMENGEILDVISDDGELKIYALFSAPSGDDTELIVEFSDIIYKDDDNNEVQATGPNDVIWDDIIQWDWSVVDSYGETQSTADTGMCEMILKSGQETLVGDLVTSLGCTTSQNNQESPGENEQGNTQGISYIEFRYCGQENPPLCFPDNETFCVALEWYLPTTTPAHVGDINDLQGQSVEFDLGFYTEQCRHNGEPDGPSGFSS